MNFAEYTRLMCTHIYVTTSLKKQIHSHRLGLDEPMNVWVPHTYWALFTVHSMVALSKRAQRQSSPSSPRPQKTLTMWLIKQAEFVPVPTHNIAACRGTDLITYFPALQNSEVACAPAGEEGKSQWPKLWDSPVLALATLLVQAWWITNFPRFLCLHKMCRVLRNPFSHPPPSPTWYLKRFAWVAASCHSGSPDKCARVTFPGINFLDLWFLKIKKVTSILISFCNP